MVSRAFLFSLLLSCAACGYQPRDRGQPDQIAKDRSGAALTFGGIDPVAGTRFFTIPIVRVEHGGSGSFSNYAGGDERNRLIVDSTTGASRRVLPNTDFSIVNWIEPKLEMAKTGDVVAIEQAVDGNNQDRSSGVYAAVVKRGGRKDKGPATYDLLFGRFEDGTQVWAARGLSGVESVWLTPDQKLAVVAATPKGAIFRLYDLTTFAQLLDAPLNL
jgi:hypothetical protein